MSHQPYENWIFEGDHLPPEQQKQLNVHLADCPQCRQLNSSLQAVHTRLSNSSQIAPAKGFTQRWQDTLQNRLIEQQKKQTLQVRRFFLLLGSATILSTLSLIILSLVGEDWIGRLIDTANRMQMINHWAIKTHDFLFAVLQTIPTALPVMFCLFIGSIFAFLVLIWLFSIWRISSQGVKSR